MSERAELARETVDVFVDVVRSRPGERGDQTHAETHDSPSVVGERGAARTRRGRPSLSI
jgi:hypothetical protein